jgi:structural maintenance of chromosome 2
LRLTCSQAEAAIQEKRVEVAKIESSHEIIKDKHTSFQATLNNAEELLQTLLTGLSSKNAGQSGGGYMGQLADARARLTQATTEEEQSRVKLASTEKDLKTLQARWKEVEREAGEGKRNLAAMKADVEKAKRKLESSGWNAEKEKEGETALRDARNEAREWTEVSGILH